MEKSLNGDYLPSFSFVCTPKSMMSAAAVSAVERTSMLQANTADCTSNSSTSPLSCPPVFAAKALRRKAQEICAILAPIEETRRTAIHHEEALARYQLQTSRFQTTQASTRIVAEEDAARSICQFTERTERRMIISRFQKFIADVASIGVDAAASLQVTLQSPNGRGDSRASSGTASFAGSMSGGGGSMLSSQRRGINGTQIVSQAQKQFMAAMDQLERDEQAQRAAHRALEQAARYHMSTHSFYNEFYEYDVHLFDNVPRVDPEEARVRARAMLMLHETRARIEVAYEWYDMFTDMCKVLSPFIPVLVNQLEWKDLLTEYFNEHFHYLDNAWKCEELYQRDVIMTKFREETFRVLATVHAYVVIQEPAKRRVVRREERRHWSSLMAHEHPRMTQLRQAHMRFMLRRYFRKLVGLREFHAINIQQQERITIMASLALEATRKRYFQSWRHLVLRKRQLHAVALHAKDQMCNLGLRYLNTWSAWSNTQIRHQFTTQKLLRRTAELVQKRVQEMFHSWLTFRRVRQAAGLLKANNQHFARRVATRWFWGCWRMKRRKQYRVKFFKLERLAEQWRIERTCATWGQQGFLALRKAKREKHEELAALANSVHQQLTANRWRVWRLFLKRRKQGRLSLKLEQVNKSYIKVRRLATWLSLIRERTAVRKVNCLIVRLVPQFIAPWWNTWRTVVGRKNRNLADELLIRNQERSVVSILPLWQHWAHRHRYRRLVVQEGQLEHLALRNAFRYRLNKFREWTGAVLHSRRLHGVATMERHSHDLHRARVFQLWNLYRVQHPKIVTLERMSARAGTRLLKSSWTRWMRLALSKDKRNDKRMIARSLERSNTHKWLRSLLRRFHTRSLAMGWVLNRIGRDNAVQVDDVGRLAHFEDAINSHHRLNRWGSWIHCIQLRKDTAVADNLATVNSDRWRKTIWNRWQTCAHRRALTRRVEELRIRNQCAYERQVWRRVLQSKWHVNTLRRLSLGNIRMIGEVRLMLRVLQEWVTHAKTWKRQILAETLRQANATIVLRPFMTKLQHYVQHRAVQRVSALSFSLNGDVAGRRYFARWVAYLRRRVSLQVNFIALSMLREHWTRRNGWSSWCTFMKARHRTTTTSATALPSDPSALRSVIVPVNTEEGVVPECPILPPDTAAGIETSHNNQQLRPASGARGFLRSLQAKENRMAQGREVL
uniref:Sfi1 spindle body domain-containing protein n=1 Tax=Bodo saltans TaxID=75058 RepID=B6DTE7_BODSA|nr:hypothetical protein [Bodo saltans]